MMLVKARGLALFHSNSRRLALVAAAGITLLQACGETTAPVGSVVLNTQAVSLTLGSTTQLTATTLGGGTDTLRGRTVTWTSSNEAVARVSAAGLVTAVSVGTATVTATSEGKTATATITVTPVPVSSVTLSPILSNLVVGATQQLTASTLDAQGNSLGGRTVTYSSNNEAVATVSSSGLVTARAAGTATITATSEGRSAQVSVVVSPVPVATVTVSPNPINLTVGGSAQVSASARDAAGNQLTGRVVTWASSNENVAVVSSTGRVVATGIGSTVISATVEGRVGQAGVTVISAVSTVTISPTSPVLAVGTTVQLTATTLDQNGTSLGRPVTWSSSDNSVATVNANGLVTALALGTATITATSEGRTATTVVTVATPVNTVEVAPTAVALAAGQTAQITATAKDAQGNVITGRTVSWSSSNTAIATVSSTGLITGVAQGTATITATVEGKTATVTATIGAALPSRVDVDPPTATMIVNEQIQLTARAVNTQGAVLSGQTFTWSSSNTAVVTVSSTGRVISVGPGTATITVTASPSGLSGTATITVVSSESPAAKDRK